MKKNDWILLSAVALYSYLFYEQSPGINFLLFSLALIAALVMRDRSVSKNKNWLLAAAGSLASAACVAWYGNNLSVIANIISLSLLSGLSARPETSLLFALLFSLYSYVSSIAFLFIGRARKRLAPGEKPGGSVKRTTLLLIPFLIAIAFFFMYRGSNILFNEFAKKLNLDFISWNWIAFTALGALLLYGFFCHRVIRAFARFDHGAGNTITPGHGNSFSLFGKPLSVADENFSGVALFIMLNALLLIVNALDFNFLFVDGKLPVGLTYSEFVHQGTGMLITSIIIGVLIILFYFRGSINFYERNQFLRLLAYLWIIQNVFVLFSTSLRNEMYIHEYGLTYKRIGVYVYLFLTVIGLCTALIKIGRIKSNMYLFRINSVLFYGVLLVSCFVNWDRLITWFNINHATQLEKQYLVGLGTTNLPALYELRYDTLAKHKIFNLNSATDPADAVREYQQPFSFDVALDRKLFLFLNGRESSGWQSWNYDGQKVFAKLKEQDHMNHVLSLDLTSAELHSLEGLAYFPHLKKLDLYNNPVESLAPLAALTELEELTINSRAVTDYMPL
jgi:hypothetical protein